MSVIPVYEKNVTILSIDSTETNLWCALHKSNVIHFPRPYFLIMIIGLNVAICRKKITGKNWILMYSSKVSTTELKLLYLIVRSYLQCHNRHLFCHVVGWKVTSCKEFSNFSRPQLPSHAKLQTGGLIMK